jgi:hypothetical protein
VSTFRPLQVRDCQGLLWALFAEYPDNSRVAFEGHLESLRLDELEGSSCSETAALQRQTLVPELDFVVVPITRANVGSLQSALTRPGILGRDGCVVHVQMEVDGEPILVACDKFHDECTVVSPAVPEALLRRLLTTGVLRGCGDAWPGV